MTDRVPVRPDLAEVAPYGAPQLDVPVRLNTNETPEPPPPGYLAAVGERLAGLELNRYPDRGHRRLREALGAVHGLPAGRVWCANGSNEVLLQLFLAYGGPGRRMLLFQPGYSAHPLIARVALTDTVAHDLPADFRLAPGVADDAVTSHQPDVVVVASPNNPTGIPVAPAAVRALHDAGRALVVVDEAYVEFGGESAVALLEELPRLVVTRTFSKALRLAGLRLGYLLGPEWVVEDVGKVRLPYHLDTVKQAAALVALERREELLAHIGVIAAERERLAREMRAVTGVEVFASSANFLLFRTCVEGLFQGLLDQGVLVRDLSDQPRLAGCLRVTVGTREENDAFLDALRRVVGEVAA